MGCLDLNATTLTTALHFSPTKKTVPSCTLQWKQCGPLVRTLASRSRVPGFKTHSDHLLNLFLVAPGSTSRSHLQTANWFVSGQLGFLAVAVDVFCRFVDCLSLALKSPSEEWSIKYVLYTYLINEHHLVQ